MEVVSRRKHFVFSNKECLTVLRDENMGSKQPSIKKKGFRFQEDGQFWKLIVRSLKWKAFDKYPVSSPLLSSFFMKFSSLRDSFQQWNKTLRFERKRISLLFIFIFEIRRRKERKEKKR